MKRLAPGRRLLCALLLGLLVLYWRPLTSRVLSNLGMIELSRVLVNSLQSPRLEFLERAESLLQQASSLDSQNPSAHRGLAWVGMVRGNTAEAALQWRAAGATAQDMALWADQARRAGRPSEALLWYEQMALLEPRSHPRDDGTLPRPGDGETLQQDQTIYRQYLLLVEIEGAARGLRPDDPAIWIELIRFWRGHGEPERADSLCLQAQNRTFAAEVVEVCSRP